MPPFNTSFKVPREFWVISAVIDFWQSECPFCTRNILDIHWGPNRKPHKHEWQQQHLLLPKWKEDVLASVDEKIPVVFQRWYCFNRRHSHGLIEWREERRGEAPKYVSGICFCGLATETGTKKLTTFIPIDTQQPRTTYSSVVVLVANSAEGQGEKDNN